MTRAHCGVMFLLWEGAKPCSLASDWKSQTLSPASQGEDALAAAEAPKQQSPVPSGEGQEVDICHDWAPVTSAFSTHSWGQNRSIGHARAPGQKLTAIKSGKTWRNPQLQSPGTQGLPTAGAHWRGRQPCTTSSPRLERQRQQPVTGVPGGGCRAASFVAQVHGGPRKTFSCLHTAISTRLSLEPEAPAEEHAVTMATTQPAFRATSGNTENAFTNSLGGEKQSVPKHPSSSCQSSLVCKALV